MQPPTILPVVLGTAGHIDHGKSTLVRALTGIDPDRLKEEKERGLTIDLGFARMELPDGRRIGIVDVPGHERFVRNMVAGATGIDAVLLVVAADDAVMPQTREHLAIMELLGVGRGIVALTKVDLVDPELVELAEADVRDCVRGSFLDGAPIVRVSGTTGEGLEVLRERLFALAAETEPRSAEGVFRMPVQRVFSARGFGTVLTGIPVSGSVRTGDVLEVLPGGLRGRVRGIQAYHDAAESARAGHSTALNLTDIDHGAVGRGHVVATPGYFRASTLLAARFSALPGLPRPVENRTPVRLHTGTADALGELVLLDVPELEPGGAAFVQLRLDEPVVCAPGDRFVLRRASPVETLGGGQLIEQSAHRLKRFKRFVLEDLERCRRHLGSPVERVAEALRRVPERWLALAELAVVAQRSRTETAQLLGELGRAGTVHALGAERWMHTEVLAASLAELEAATTAWFEAHPLRHHVDVRELRRATGFEAALMAALLQVAEQRGRLEPLPGGRVRPVGRTVRVDPESAALRERLLARIEGAGLRPPTEGELTEAVGGEGAAVGAVVALLVDEGVVERVGGSLLASAAQLARAREAIVANCRRHGRLEIPELRDALDTSRKYLLPILEHFDTQGLTLRQGGHRVLRGS